MNPQIFPTLKPGTPVYSIEFDTVGFVVRATENYLELRFHDSANTKASLNPNLRYPPWLHVIYHREHASDIGLDRAAVIEEWFRPHRPPPTPPQIQTAGTALPTYISDQIVRTCLAPRTRPRLKLRGRPCTNS